MVNSKKQPTLKQRAEARYIDLTKTGPISYRDLRSLYNNLPEEPEAIANMPGPPGMDITLDRAGKINWDPNTDFGESIYDPGIANTDQIKNLQDVRANEQPWYAQWGAGLLKNMGLAATTFLDGTVGLAYGIGQGISNLADDDPNTGFW